MQRAYCLTFGNFPVRDPGFEQRLIAVIGNYRIKARVEGRYACADRGHNLLATEAFLANALCYFTGAELPQIIIHCVSPSKPRVYPSEMQNVAVCA